MSFANRSSCSLCATLLGASLLVPQILAADELTSDPGPSGLHDLPIDVIDPVIPAPEDALEGVTFTAADKLLELLGDAPLPDHPQLQPLVPTVLEGVGFGPMQADPEGYFSAPTTAPVGSRVPVDITYDDRHSVDNLILVRADAPDNALGGPSGRNTHRIHDEDRIYRRGGDMPGMYELRLRRHDGFDRRIMARQQIELVDVEIDLQVPEAVTPHEEFEVYMNPVLGGHLVITGADRDPENLVGLNARRDYAVEDAEGPGLFTRTAPRSRGEYELRFHFTPPPRGREATGREGRLVARATLNVVGEDALDDATPEEMADKLTEIEEQIAELSANIEQVTLAQTQDLRETIAALGLPALALLTDLLTREAVAPQLAFALTTPLPPAQWPGVTAAPAPAAQPAAQPQPAAPAAPAPAIAAPQTTTSYRVTGVAGGDVLNIRSGPGAENTIVGMLPPNAIGITLTGESAQAADGGTWWRITDPTLPGGTGWVNARFLAAEAAPAPASDSVMPLRVSGIAANEVLYLRSAPSSDAPIVAILAPDASGIQPTGEVQLVAGTEWIEIWETNAAPDGKAWALAANLAPETDIPNVLDIATAYTDQPGAMPMDPSELYHLTEAILHYARDSAFAPGYLLSPLTRAIVTAQAVDGRLPHVRYHLTLGQVETGAFSAGGGHEWIEVVELRRFNLGPARHAQEVAAHGAENTAAPEHFGEGPDVVWRFAMRPLRGVAAEILSASRAEIDTPERDCMGFHCQIGQSIIPHLTDWSEMQPVDAPQGFRPSYDELWRGAPSAPALLDMLALLSPFTAQATGHDADWQRFEPRWERDPEDPIAHVIIEVGLGQEAGGEVMLFETDLLDDELRSIWSRLAAIGGPADTRLFRASAAERWPHRE